MIRLKLTTLTALLFLVCATAYGQTTIYVHQGDNLQNKINAAQRGDTLVLDAGATFTGPIELPDKAGTDYITIRSSGVSSLPEGHRVKPSDKQYMATIVSPPLQPALKTKPKASFYKLVGIEFTMPNQDGLPQDDGLTTYAIVQLGDAAYTTDTDLPGNLILDRCYIHGWDARAVKRGVEIHSKETSITNSYISKIHWTGESQAIGGYNGPGPYHIINNYLESSGPNIIFGGAPPNIQNMIANGVEVRRNHLYKQPSWHPAPTGYCSGSLWRVKGLFELKSAKNVTVEGNVMEYSWGCMGYGAINLTVRNDSPPGENKNSWATVQNVTIKNNILRHMLTGVNILGLDDNGQPSFQGHGIVFENNLFEDINGLWGEGNTGTWIRIKSMNDVTFNHNTALGSDYGLMVMNTPTVAGSKMTGFVMKNNIASYGLYGFAGLVPASTPGAPFTEGEDAVKAYLANPPLPPIHHNVFIGGESGLYPSYASSNYWPATINDVGFVDYPDDYSLAPGTTYQSDDNPAKDIGVDFDELNAATAGVLEGTPPGGNSLSLNGTSAHVLVPHAQNLAVSGAITVEAWFKVNSIGAYQTIVAKESQGMNTGGGYELQVTNTGKVRAVFYRDNNTFTQIVSTSTVTPGVWHHVAGTFNETHRRVFLDGALEDTTLGNGPTAGGGDLRIGRRNTGAYYLNGLVDEVRVSNAALYDVDFRPAAHLTPLESTIGLWKLDGGQTVTDSSDNANHGTLQGGATYSPDVPVTSHYSLSVDGGSHVLVADSDDLSVSGVITVEAWFKVNSIGAYQTIVAKESYGVAGTLGGYELQVTNTGKVRVVFLQTHNTYSITVGTTTVTPGVWHHVAGTFDLTNRRLFLDGVLDTPPESGGGPTAGENSLRIGRRNNGTYHFNGLIDEVRVSNAALYTANFTPRRNLPARSSTVGLWKFSQTAGDSSGKGHNGTLQGGAGYSTDVPPEAP